MPRPLKIVVTCKKINETCGFSVFFYFRNHRISLCIYTKLSNFTKKRDFSVLWLKGYCVTKMFFVFFSKLFISWNRKLNWLTRTWNFMDFFSWDAMPQARGVFLLFLIHRICPGLRPPKSIKIQKNALFSFFCFFFILLRDSSRLTDFLKVCEMRFSGTRVSKFWKIHDSGTGR